jgi:hypothetical protein
MNEFDELLEYLNSSENKKTSKKIIKNLEVTQKQQVAQKEVKVEDYNMLHSDVRPVVSLTSQSSIGFDVQRFNDLCLNRLKYQYETGQNYERTYYSVTELLQCIRSIYFQRLKFKADLDKLFTYPPLLLIQEVGKQVHKIVQSVYGFEETEKTVIDKKYNVKGKVDSIIKNFLYELKTIDAEKFKGSYLNDHFNQGCIYSYILNENYNYNIDTISIVYFLRDFKKIYSFDVKYDKEVALKFLNKALVLKQCIETKTIPSITDDTEQCLFCSYKENCSKDINYSKKEESVFLL